MEWKRPLTVITDGDNAMRQAIGALMTGVVHHLCSWHIKQNVIKNVKVLCGGGEVSAVFITK